MCMVIAKILIGVLARWLMLVPVHRAPAGRRSSNRAKFVLLPGLSMPLHCFTMTPRQCCCSTVVIFVIAQKLALCYCCILLIAPPAWPPYARDLCFFVFPPPPPPGPPGFIRHIGVLQCTTIMANVLKHSVRSLHCNTLHQTRQCCTLVAMMRHVQRCVQVNL